MGLLDYFFDPLYGEATKKKADKPKPKETPAPRPKAEKPVVERLPTPVPVPQATPILAQQPQFAQAPLMSPQELQAAADYLLGAANEPDVPWPTFNIEDLKKAAMKVDPGELPLDVRPIAAISDTLYGTNIYNRTPNLRAERLDELSKIKSLGSDSQALQQVIGQARLAEYKANLDKALKSRGIMSPLDKAKTLREIKRALGGGGTEELAQLRLMMGIDEKNRKSLEDAAEENRKRKDQLLEKGSDMAKEWQNDKLVQNYQTAREKTNRIRTLLNDPNRHGRGINDYMTTIEYIKNLDPDSTVMLGEAKSLAQTGSVIDGILNAPQRIINGAKFTDAQRDAMLRTIDSLETIWEQRYKAARAAKAQDAANRGIDPNVVVGPVDTRVKTSKGKYRFSPANGGDDYIIDADKVTKFKDWAKANGVKLIPRGKE